MESGVIPEVSLVIPCRNEVRHIRACLSAIREFEAPPGGFEVLVVDGMSADGTREVVREIAGEDPRVRLVDNPERTTPHALNIGLKAARGTTVVRIDAHTRYSPDYLVACLETLQKTGADNVGGPWVAVGTGYVQRAIAAAFSSGFAVGGGRSHRSDYEGPVDTVYLGCWPKHVLEGIGGFDEELVRNQDDELNLRLSRAGGRIWQSPRIRSWYTPRDSLRLLLRQYFQYGYWKVRVIQKHRLPASVRHLIPGGFAGALLGLAVLATVWAPSRAALLLLVGLYVMAAGLAAVITAARSEWSILPLLPVVFACYHLGYGFGFLAGVWDFLVLRKGGRFSSLTR